MTGLFLCCTSGISAMQSFKCQSFVVLINTSQCKHRNTVSPQCSALHYTYTSQYTWQYSAIQRTRVGLLPDGIIMGLLSLFRWWRWRQGFITGEFQMVNYPSNGDHWKLSTNSCDLLITITWSMLVFSNCSTDRFEIISANAVHCLC